MTVDIYLIDDQEYGLIKEQKVEDKVFCYFVNIEDNKDIIIKKYDKKKNIISINDKEFESAIKYFCK